MIANSQSDARIEDSSKNIKQIYYVRAREQDFRYLLAKMFRDFFIEDKNYISIK